MNPPLMGTDHLLSSEVKTASATSDVYSGTMESLPGFLDPLFQMPYFVDHPDPETLEGGFHSWCFGRYVQAPYTVRTIWILWERAHYAEAAVIVRHLLETFVQMRYFLDHKDELQPHLTATSQSKRVAFKVMFEELAPGYYVKYYGRLLSSIAHSGIAATIFDVVSQEESGAAKLEPRLGCEFSERSANYIINQTLVLILGYLTYFPKCFPSYENRADDGVEAVRRNAIAILDAWNQGHAAQYGNTKEWHSLTDRIVR